MYITGKNKKVDLSSCKEIAAGGEGRVLEHPTDHTKVIKIYHQARKASFKKHLEFLSQLPDQFVKPGEIYFTDNGSVAGFEMRYVNFNDYSLFNNLFNKGYCHSNGISNDFKISVLTKLRSSVEDLHSKKIIVGDLNQYNLFFSKNGDILLVDVDSYQSDYNPHSGVLLDEIRDWTTMDINQATDSWAFDILSFWVTTFCHPFKWVAKGNAETLEQRIKAHKSILTRIPDVKIPALYNAPVGEILKQFTDIFSGRRYMVDFKGVHVVSSAIVNQPVLSISLTIKELVNNAREVYACENYISVRTNNGWQRIETKIVGVTRTITERKDCDYLFPSQNDYSFVKDSVLNSSMGSKQYGFTDPQFYYSNGSLITVDYAMNVMACFDLSSTAYGFSLTTTPVFAKSIIFRNCVIQNFGGSVYIIAPFKNSYTLYKTAPGIKDAFYCNQFYSAEYKVKNKTRFALVDTATKKELDLDYLPHFAVKERIIPVRGSSVLIQRMIFIPENGAIDIYIDLQKVSTLDVSNCTRASQLFNTNAGIIMLESNTIYLLNTKQ